jgi:hypothetical protein
MSVPRKTMKEIRLEERIGGFYDCLYLFEELWRKNLGNLGPISTMLQSKITMEALYEDGIHIAQQKIRPDDDEYRNLRQARIEAG